MRVALVVPHIFMQRDILPHVIFSPGTLALDLAENLQAQGATVTLFSPGPVDVSVQNITADLSFFEEELKNRDTTYLELLKNHSFTFITFARQLQSELIADAFRLANMGEYDIVHVYTNEEDIALPFIQFCKVPVVLTHHDPFNFLLKYKSVFPKYRHLHWLSMSYAQRNSMPDDTNWAGNIYHGLPKRQYVPVVSPTEDYIAYLGRIVKSKGVHLAIQAIQQHNAQNKETPLKLKIAGKHYTGHKDNYWKQHIEPHIDGKLVEYVGFIGDTKAKQQFLGNAKALMVPSVFDEPFGMVLIEAMACGTPVIGLSSGAIPEVIRDCETGILVDPPLPKTGHTGTVESLVRAIDQIGAIDRRKCREVFEQRFTTERMASEHIAVYDYLLTKQQVAL